MLTPITSPLVPVGGLPAWPAPLTEYAWKYRYPGESDEPRQPEAEQALATARNVYDAILNRQLPNARP